MMIKKTPKKNFTVFVIGCPRSGKTLLHRTLSQHREFGWFSQYVDKHPGFLPLSAMNLIYNVKLIRNLNLNYKVPFLPEPVEAWNVWKRYAPVFGDYMGSLTAEDVSCNVRQQLREVVKKNLAYQNKTFFITDYGRPARMEFLNEIFPNSRFIHVVRDGRAVAYEILKIGWMDQITDLGKTLVNVPEDYIAEWIDSNRDKRVAAAIRWKVALNEIVKQKKSLCSDQYLQINYEQFVGYRTGTFRKIYDFLGLESDEILDNALRDLSLKNMNFLFETALTVEDRTIINNSLKETLNAFGYQ